MCSNGIHDVMGGRCAVPCEWSRLPVVTCMAFMGGHHAGPSLGRSCPSRVCTGELTGLWACIRAAPVCSFLRTYHCITY